MSCNGVSRHECVLVGGDCLRTEVEKVEKDRRQLSVKSTLIAEQRLFVLEVYVGQSLRIVLGYISSTCAMEHSKLRVAALALRRVLHVHLSGIIIYMCL
jgi:hypothetical protein